MSISVSFSIISDTASPAVREIAARVTPRRIGEAIATPLRQLVQDNYASLGTNKKDWPTTQFWERASKATREQIDDTGVTIITAQQGVRQRLMGGKIEAVNAKNLAIAATQETYGHSPREFSNLKYVQFGRGQDAPKALVAIRATATNIEPKKRGKPGFKATSQQIGQVVMFWLTPEVNQVANPNVLPTRDQFVAAIDAALQPLSALN